MRNERKYRVNLFFNNVKKKKRTYIILCNNSRSILFSSVVPLFSTRGGKNLPKDNEGDTERGKNVETARKNGKKVWLSSASVPSVRGTRQLTPSSCDEGKHESNSTQGEEKCTEMYEKKGTIQTERGKNINLQLIITSADNTLHIALFN